ncbi:uncharacterized protein LOC111795921 isoform X1 [Cucurbita pepo subsp. pepo]|uniref:uncharacterized protein LOC111795921 isoform X1 n=1 Tax=Cucurbita pepo subsp. pepo TaxID=3664 RepID=UPI000C9D5B41|nr:uncharacterized protein LOC111795921 isoform X1 [Cucurbita pepo subsp. pepo]
MGAKHMQSNSSMVGKASKSHKMVCKAIERPSREFQQPSPKSLAAASSRVACCRNQRSCTCKRCMEFGRHNEISLKLVQKNEAAEPFMSKKFVGVADKQCKQLLDALGIFNSNRELFVNLLHDPNSLLIKRIEDSTDSRDKKQQTKTFFNGRLSENKIKEVGEYEEPAHSHNLKPCDSDDSLSLERIVVLKPNPSSSLHAAVGTNSGSSLKSHSSFIKNVESNKGTLFSFRQIKRKMKQAMRVGRKEDECLSTNGMSMETPLVYRAPKDDQLDKVFYSRNGDKTASTSESNGVMVGQSAVTGHLKRQKSKKREGDKEVVRKMKARPWGWVMCFSDDDILPSNKPGCHTAAHTRHAQLSNKKFIYEKSKSQNDEKQRCETPQMARRDDDQWQGSNAELNVSYVLSPDVKVNEYPTIEGSVKIVKDIAIIPHEGNIFCEASSSGFDNKFNGFREKASLELSKRNLALEAQEPSSLSRFQTVEDPNGLCDREVQPLPETIHLVAAAASSHLAFTPRTADESTGEALPISFEESQCTGLASLQEVLDPAISTFNCCCSVSKYVLELLQVSNQNWNELSVDCHSSAWLRIPFVDKVKLFGTQLCGDCVLVFDYFNEVLEDVFQCYIRCSPWLSSYKAHIQAPNKENALYHEVMQHMDWPLLQQQPPQTLDHLCLRDLRCRTWMNYPTETEEIVTIIAESVLRELVIESVVYLGL